VKEEVMADTGRTWAPAPGATPVTRPTGGYLEEKRSRWVGWILFAGLMMVLVGAFQAVMGFVALFDDGYFLVNRDGLVVSVDYTTWGWVHLAIGAVAVATGIGVMVGQTWARVVGIVFAAVGLVVNVGFIAAYPVWSLLVIAFDVLVIYALAVHGREMRV
jgi:hypothetical protein